MGARPQTGAVERRLRQLVEDAGFELAVSLDEPGYFRITTKELQPVASAVVMAAGFRATFPAQRLQVSTASALVDALEKTKEEKQ